MQISTHIINLPSRPERRQAVLKEFENKPEFTVTVVDAIQNEVGLLGLWSTMKQILQDCVQTEDELILICQDDHQFTEHYSFEKLQQCIEDAKALDADILLGGVSWFQSAFFSTENLFWTEKFSGLQFAIFFKRFFKPFLDLELDDFDAGDYRISAFTDRKWVIWPYISTQQDYGYSDVTLKNNKPERQQTLFRQSEGALNTLLEVSRYFNKRMLAGFNVSIDLDTVTIPTFIINLPERCDRLAHIRQEFNGRQEFDITIVEAIKDPVGALGLWKTIRNIVTTAMENEEDLIIICEDDHVFTNSYSKQWLVTSILYAHELAADILMGGPSGGFSHILPITDELCWINAFYGSQFMVLYRKIFPLILNEPFDESVTADNILSQIAANKLSFYPFISVQKDFGYSDVNDRSLEYRHINYVFEQSTQRFERVVLNFKLYGMRDK
ncbi:glycosyltransferase family 25 protein [Niabella drilacis]|uniref:Glycosyltransferase involved in LPS biosynthesis, GR25 family n=1 Tax=Niabella drilacis (strain DSM 25811 / CCM 8410 / CCUG 62505 / LMG 26954 / E90) TaxID=1285928 RepID=A0A1G7B0C2_NIADE|nr:hypothetical protein [Niabella drilacis]SDE20370.1 hypothetical protein SAMN04487894_12622 [Niabella drilacis]